MAKYYLVGVDGNAYAIMAYVKKAMRLEGCSKEEIDAYLADAKSSDYNHLLCVSMEVVDRLNAKYADEESEGEPLHTITEDFAWEVFNVINKWKIGMFGECTLQEALDKEL